MSAWIKYFSVCLFMMIAADLHAQDYRKLRLGIGGGYSLPEGVYAKGGPVAWIEPGFRITDNLLLGAKVEGGLMDRGLSSALVLNRPNPSTTSVSYSMFIQVYFSKQYFKPFIAAGGGYRSMITAGDLDVTHSHTQYVFPIGESSISLFGRAGFDLGRFTVTADYNFAGVEHVSPFLEINNNYIAVRAGIFFGGSNN